MISVKTDPGQPVQESDYMSEWNYAGIETARTNLETVGFTCINTEFGDGLLSRLRSEARTLERNAVQVSGTHQCQYQAHLAGLGDAGSAFLAGERLSNLLDDLLGIPLKPELDASCYTYYRPGDALGPHLDHPEQCIVTVILYLDVVHPDIRPAESGLELHILGSTTPDENKPLAILPTKAGSLIIGQGAKTWHKRPTLQNGEHVTALTACYSRHLPT
jgi:alkylated DNA repair dioxygenase AlkB